MGIRPRIILIMGIFSLIATLIIGAASYKLTERNAIIEAKNKGQLLFHYILAYRQYFKAQQRALIMELVEEDPFYPLPVLGVDVLERVLAGHFPRVAKEAVVGSAVKPAPVGVHQGYHVGQVLGYQAEIFVGFARAAAAFCLFHRSFGSVS